MRSYKECYTNLKKYLIEPLNPDIFIHTWETIGASHKEDLVVHDLVSEPELLEMYQPKSLIIESNPKNSNLKLHGKSIPDELVKAEPIHHRSALPMFYQIIDAI